MAGKWIGSMHLKRGALHADLGIAPDKKLTDADLARGARSSDPKTRRRTALARTFRSFSR